MSDYKQDFRRRADQAKAWMFDAAFPFWSDRARHATGGFLEALDLTGRPLAGESSRVRVQARQTYCFALAMQLGWQTETARAMCLFGINTLVNACRRADGLFGRLYAYEGALLDPVADLYDSAFARLAFATALQAGLFEAREPLLDITYAIEKHLRRQPAEEGYAETLPFPEDRNQNPHMHLYESALAHLAADAGPKALQQAYGLERLMATRFIQSEKHILRERFGPDWGPHAEDHVETGHHYEWVWLLHRRALLDKQAVHPDAHRLYAKALQFTGADGQVWLKQSHDGDILDSTQRSWGLTEAVKAHLVCWDAGHAPSAKYAIEAYDRLWHLHIKPAIEGGWLDAYDQTDTAISTHIPASIGYHIFLAFAEWIRISGRI